MIVIILEITNGDPMHILCKYDRIILKDRI